MLLVVGCAGPTYTADPLLKQRAVRTVSKAVNCVSPGEAFMVHLVQTDEPNAWLEPGKKIYITEGMLTKFNTNTILFVAAHEISHYKLDHIQKTAIVTYGITGAMLAANLVVPGIGILNHAVNPAITNNYGKTHELEADRLAVESCIRCFGFTKEQSIDILKSLNLEGGGFWNTHPSAQDRVENISKLPHSPGQTVSWSAPPSGTVQEKPSQLVQPSGLFDSPFLKQTPRIQ